MHHRLVLHCSNKGTVTVYICEDTSRMLEVTTAKRRKEGRECARAKERRYGELYLHLEENVIAK